MQTIIFPSKTMLKIKKSGKKPPPETAHSSEDDKLSSDEEIPAEMAGTDSENSDNDDEAQPARLKLDNKLKSPSVEKGKFQLFTLLYFCFS